MDFNVFGDDEEADEIAFYLDWDRNYVWSYINEFGRLPPLPTPSESFPEFYPTNGYHPYFHPQLQSHENNIQNLEDISPPGQALSGNLMTYHHPNTFHNDISIQQQQQQNNHTSVETVHPGTILPEGQNALINAVQYNLLVRHTLILYPNFVPHNVPFSLPPPPYATQPAAYPLPGIHPALFHHFVGPPPSYPMLPPQPQPLQNLCPTMFSASTSTSFKFSTR